MLNKQTLISIEDALPGREQPMQIEDCHFVNQSSLTAPLAHHQQQHLWVMRVGLHQIQPTKKCVRVKPVILRL